MNAQQEQHINNLIAGTNARIMEQKRLENEARLRADSLMYFKGQLEDLRTCLLESVDPRDKGPRIGE